MSHNAGAGAKDEDGLELSPAVFVRRLSLQYGLNRERERELVGAVEAAGGFVEFNRANGNLALSRALGEFVFKMNEQLPQV